MATAQMDAGQLLQLSLCCCIACWTMSQHSFCTGPVKFWGPSAHLCSILVRISSHCDQMYSALACYAIDCCFCLVILHRYSRYLIGSEHHVLACYSGFCQCLSVIYAIWPCATYHIHTGHETIRYAAGLLTLNTVTHKHACCRRGTTTAMPTFRPMSMCPMKTLSAVSAPPQSLRTYAWCSMQQLSTIFSSQPSSSQPPCRMLNRQSMTLMWPLKQPQIAYISRQTACLKSLSLQRHQVCWMDQHYKVLMRHPNRHVIQLHMTQIYVQLLACDNTLQLN